MTSPAPDRRILKIDGAVFLIAALIALSVPVQHYMPDGGLCGALSAQGLRHGKWWTLVTYMLPHGGVLHAALNAAAALALGKATRGFFPPGWAGGAGFLAFYLACGVVAGLGYVASNPFGGQPAVGASGAIFGLWGAFARATPWPGEVGPWWSPQMRVQLQGAVISNLVVLVAGLVLAGGMVIAWQAHVAGFIAGVVLIGPFARIFKGQSRSWDLPDARI